MTASLQSSSTRLSPSAVFKLISQTRGNPGLGTWGKSWNPGTGWSVPTWPPSARFVSVITSTLSFTARLNQEVPPDVSGLLGNHFIICTLQTQNAVMMKWWYCLIQSINQKVIWPPKRIFFEPKNTAGSEGQIWAQQTDYIPVKWWEMRICKTLGRWLARPVELERPLALLSLPGILRTETGCDEKHLKPILTLSKSFWSAAEMLTFPGEAMPAAFTFFQLRPYGEWRLLCKKLPIWSKCEHIAGCAGCTWWRVHRTRFA